MGPSGPSSTPYEFACRVSIIPSKKFRRKYILTEFRKDSVKIRAREFRGNGIPRKGIMWKRNFVKNFAEFRRRTEFRGYGIPWKLLRNYGKIYWHPVCMTHIHAKNTPLPKKSASVSHRELKFCTTFWLYLKLKCNASLGLNLPSRQFYCLKKAKLQIFSDLIKKVQYK